MILWHLFFDQYPIDFRLDKIKELETKYKNGHIPLNFDKSYLKNQGPKVLMKLILKILLLCIYMN